MNTKYILLLVLASLVGAFAYAIVVKRQMPHGPAGFETQEPVQQEAQQETGTPQGTESLGTFPGMGERQVAGESPFALKVSLSSESPAPGEEVTINAQITSQTAPHARTKVSLYQNGEPVREVEGVIPPYQTETATFTWSAAKGVHTLKVVVASAVGVEFASWEETLEI